MPENVLQNCWIYFTCPPGKSPVENTWKGESPSKNTVKMIGQIFCLTRLTWSCYNHSLPGGRVVAARCFLLVHLMALDVSPQDTSHLQPRISCGAGFRRLRAVKSHCFKQSRSLPLMSNLCWCLFWAAWKTAFERGTANRSEGLFVCLLNFVQVQFCLHLQYVGIAPWNALWMPRHQTDLTKFCIVPGKVRSREKPLVPFFSVF